MKEEHLLKTLGDVDEKFIDEAAPEAAEQPDFIQIHTRKEPFYMRILPIAACAAVVGIGVTVGVLIHNNAITQPAYQPSDSSSVYVSSVSETYRVPHWDELEINGQYTRFKYNGIEYHTAGAEISAEKLGGLLGETTASGVDQYTDERHEITVSVYPIDKISEKNALAVKFPEDEKSYVYYNPNNAPKTLGEFFDDLNLTENLKISTTATCTTIENGYITNWKYSNVDTSKLMDILLSEKDSLNECYSGRNLTDEEREAALDFAVDIPILGIKNLSLQVTKGGYIQTNVYFHYLSQFYIGMDKTDSFVQYVKENCPSEITWQSDEPIDLSAREKLINERIQELENHKNQLEKEMNELVQMKQTVQEFGRKDELEVEIFQLEFALQKANQRLELVIQERENLLSLLRENTTESHADAAASRPASYSE